MAKIAITDYFSECNIEREILGDLVGFEVGMDTEVLLVWHEHINKDYIQNLPKLRGIQRYGAGYDSLDMEFLLSKDIIVCNTPDYGTDEVSDTALAFILNITRGISVYNELSKSYTDSWQENVNTRLRRTSNVTVGVVGAGRIGGSVLLKCNSLGYKTIFYDKYKERGHEKMLSSKRVDSLDELVSQSDIISFHVPLNSETKGMINEDLLSKMKAGTSIVNTARGGLFEDLDLLYDSLKSGHLYQLGIDVLADEPPTNNQLITDWRKSAEWLQGRVIINPHTAYYSQESYKEIRVKSAENALRIFNREECFNRLH